MSLISSRRKTKLTLPPASPPAPDVPPPGFEITKAPSGRAAKLTRWGFRAVVILTLAALVINIGQNIAGNIASYEPAAASLNADEARTAAATFTADYLSHDPAAVPSAGQDVLRRELAPGGDPARMSFAGTGFLAADVVIPGAVTKVDGGRAIVAVAARVTLGMPSAPDTVAQPAPTAPPTAPGLAANIAKLPPGYAVVAGQWLNLSIPVVRVGSGVLVDIAGPVFSADPPPAPTAQPVDSPATEKTRAWVKSLFTSYAVSSTSGAYLSAPGVDLTGLSGSVHLSGIETWQLSTADTGTPHTGTARVGWTFAPTADLTTTQSYVVTAETSDNRWFATAIGTYPTL